MCTGLTSVKIPNSVTNIGDQSFAGCTGLTSVTIPESLTTIGFRAFDDCTELLSVYYSASNPIAGPSDVFSDNTYRYATLYLTEEAIDIAKTLQPWNIFRNIQVYNSTGIDEVIADIDEALPYEIFDFNGMKVGHSREGLTPGIYILRQGNSVKKILAE